MISSCLVNHGHAIVILPVLFPYLALVHQFDDAYRRNFDVARVDSVQYFVALSGAIGITELHIDT
jgi:hypothetical protein